MKMPTEIAKQINHRLCGSMVRNKRLEKRKSLRWLAIQMDVSAPYLSDLERGRRNWTQKRYDLALQIISRNGKGKQRAFD